MRQFIGMIGDDRRSHDLALSLVAPPLRAAGERLAAAEAALHARGRGAAPREQGAARVRQRARRAGARPAGTTPRCSSTRSPSAMLGQAVGRGHATGRSARSPAASRSGSPSTCCCAARDEVLLLDEPDNFLDVPGKRWLEARLRESAQVGALRLARPGAAGPDRRPGGRRRGRQRVDRIRAASPPGTRPGSPGTSGSRSSAAAGTRSTRSCASWC